MKKAKIERLGGRLMDQFSKAVGYSSALSENGEFILYVSQNLTFKEKAGVEREVHETDKNLRCKVIVTGKIVPE